MSAAKAKGKGKEEEREKPTEPAYTVVQLVAIDETGDSYYRMRWPGRHLAEQRPDWRILNLDARANERFEWAEAADLLVVYQSHDLDLIPLIHRRRAAGKKTLAEYNDNFYAPPPATPVAGAWSSPLLWQSYERFMLECDGVIVTGPGLKQLFADKATVPVHILENHIPHALKPFDSLWEEPEKEICIGLAGSLGHMSDYMAVLPTIRAVFERYPQLVLHVMGNESLPGIIGLPESRLRYTPWGSMDQYYAFWKPIHIGLAPMLDTPYNRCRSDVKALEMASCGVLPVLTRALPYEQFISKTGAPVFETFDQLDALLSGFVANPSGIREAVKRCYDYVDAERIGPKRTERVDLYASHLTNSPSSFTWPQKTGCHEILGRMNDQTQEGRVLNEAQKLLTQKRPGAAFELVQKALSENPFLAGVALAELKMLSSSLPREEWLVRYETHRKVFPDDLRFHLLRVRSETTAEGVMSGWAEIQQVLQRSSHTYREFFGMMVIQTLCEQMPKLASLVPVGEFLTQMYPNFAQLHFTLSQCFERLGEPQLALRHTRWLVEARELVANNEKFYQTFDRAFLRTWAEALEGRIAMNK